MLAVGLAHRLFEKVERLEDFLIIKALAVRKDGLPYIYIAFWNRDSLHLEARHVDALVHLVERLRLSRDEEIVENRILKEFFEIVWSLHIAGEGQGINILQSTFPRHADVQDGVLIKERGEANQECIGIFEGGKILASDDAVWMRNRDFLNHVFRLCMHFIHLFLLDTGYRKEGGFDSYFIADRPFQIAIRKNPCYTNIRT